MMTVPQVRDLVAVGPHVADRLLVDIGNEPDHLAFRWEPQVCGESALSLALIQTPQTQYCRPHVAKLALRNFLTCCRGRATKA